MKKMPVIFTFDLDAELIWRSRDPESVNMPVTMSLGEYGPKCGLPRILKVLEENDIHATFFVPGMVAEKYTEAVADIIRAGHEVGNHSYTHTYPYRLPDKAAEKEELTKTETILEKMMGRKPCGYRSPAWEFSEYTIEILKEMGFKYSSNMMGSDRIEYLKVRGEQTNIVEFPISWGLDDAAYWLYSARTQGKCMQPLSAVEDYWIREFDTLYEEFLEETEAGIDSDICYVMTCHPQIIGRPARITVLKKLIAHMKQFDQIAFINMNEAADTFLAKSGTERR